MKTIFLILLVMLIGCNETGNEGAKAVDYGNQHDEHMFVQTLDSCEYVTWRESGAREVGVSICHKGNCRYCASRAKKVVVVK